MRIQSLTNRHVVTSLLLLLVFSLSASALPCLCAGSCKNVSKSTEALATGAYTADHMSDHRSHACAPENSSNEARYTSSCNCSPSMNDQLVRFETQRSKSIFHGMGTTLDSVCEVQPSNTSLSTSFFPGEKTAGFTAVPFYVQHATFLL